MSTPSIVPMNEKALAFTTAATFSEFLESQPLYQSLMRKRYREARIPIAEQTLLTDYPDILHGIVLIAEDSPDTVIIVPLLQRIVEASPRVDLRIIRDDDDLFMLDELLDDVALTEDLNEIDLPLLLFFDEEWQLQTQWGPRPQVVEAKLDDWLERHPEYEALADAEDADAQEKYASLLNDLTSEMRLWYNSGADQACVGEIGKLIASVKSEEDAGDDEESADSINEVALPSSG